MFLLNIKILLRTFVTKK